MGQPNRLRFPNCFTGSVLYGYGIQNLARQELQLRNDGTSNASGIFIEGTDCFLTPRHERICMFEESLRYDVPVARGSGSLDAMRIRSTDSAREREKCLVYNARQELTRKKTGGESLFF